MKLAILAILFSIVSSASAQTVGSLKQISDNTFYQPDGLHTVINYSHPATSAGTVASATLNWIGGPCTAAFRVKFFRRSNETYTLTADRGPFSAEFSLVTVTLNPPVEVQAGDLIGVATLRSDCGSVLASKIDPNTVSVVHVLSNLSTFDLGTASLGSGYEINVRASADGTVREGVIPVAGSVAGDFGSNFRTSVSLTNYRNSPISGRLVYHPAGQSASAADPSMPYTLTAAETESINDIVTLLGRTGVGSIDVISTSSYPPIVNVRIYNDRGADGTSGFTEELFAVSDAFSATETAVFAVPTDTANFRVNLGVRTLDTPATIRYTITTPDGSTGNPVERTYPPNYFEQFAATTALGSLFPGGTIRVRVIAGSAYFYAATTDNRTNDSSAQFSERE